jgi:hypothetical protein
MKQALISAMLLLLFAWPALTQDGGANDQDKFPVGHGHDTGYVEVMEKVLSRTLKATSFKKYETHTLERATVYCGEKRSKEVLAVLAGIEKKFTTSFPACLSNATHPKATLFVVTEDDRAFKAFFRTLMRSYDQQWPGYAEGVNMKEQTEFWIMSNVVVINGAAFPTAESLLRVMAFGWGYMTISQTSDFVCPEALATGFGNVLEARVAGNPAITLLPETGEEDDKVRDWTKFVQAERAKNSLESIAQIFEQTVPTMQHRHYAVAWSLTEDLVQDPLLLYAMLKRCSTDNDTPRTELLTEAYSSDLETMQDRWAKTIKDQ